MYWYLTANFLLPIFFPYIFLPALTHISITDHHLSLFGQQFDVPFTNTWTNLRLSPFSWAASPEQHDAHSATADDLARGFMLTWNGNEWDRVTLQLHC